MHSAIRNPKSEIRNVKIAYLAAGAAGMYCGSCLHDNTLAAKLLELGEDVVLVPIYTPIRTDEADVSLKRVFFGGINVYLQQKWALFRHTPQWLDRWLDHPALLGSLGGRASSVDPAQLGDLTVSMLRGEAGNQRKQLDQLVDWLLEEVRPDVVHLSNSMMLGLARRIGQRCGPTVVCSLSGEDIFLEKLQQPHYDQARELLRERAADVNAFVALNHYYADYMAEYLDVDRSRVHVIAHGLNLEGHGQRNVILPTAAPRIGYLARVCHDKGLHLLVEACELLAQDPQHSQLELHAAGYLGASDRAYLRQLQQRAARGPLAGKFHYHGELDRKEKIAFLQSLHVFSTPTVYRESKGLPALEALANGVPIVVPDHGCFSELVADTGGGLLCRPHDPTDLAAKLGEVLGDAEKANRLGKAGQLAVRDRYHAEAMARHTLALYTQLVQAEAR
ncbi:MAG: glycosyltransferase family 4 protein [Planctomycetes bacterium]|nr:glycosyltransferase family 4 protein [Planctomycetota bacterium]